MRRCFTDPHYWKNPALRRSREQTLLHTNTFTHRRFYTQTLLHTETFTHRDAFTHRSFYTQTLLPTDAFTHRRFYTQTLLHTEAFTHRRLYTQTLLHTDASTHSCFYTLRRATWKWQFYFSFWRSNLISCEMVATGTRKTQFYVSFWRIEPHFVRNNCAGRLANRNFTSVFGDRTSFRAKGLRFVPSRWHCPAPSREK